MFIVNQPIIVHKCINSPYGLLIWLMAISCAFFQPVILHRILNEYQPNLTDIYLTVSNCMVFGFLIGANIGSPHVRYNCKLLQESAIGELRENQHPPVGALSGISANLTTAGRSRIQHMKAQIASQSIVKYYGRVYKPSSLQYMLVSTILLSNGRN